MFEFQYDFQKKKKKRYTLVAGSFDRTKHENIKVCAQHELSEEARLKNGTLIPLLNDENHIGIGEVSIHSSQRFFSF